MLEALDAAATRRWAAATLASLGRAREEIDALNVYPVPDGDTGTNLYLTVEAACGAALSLPEGSDLAAVTQAFAHGALLGARGNSGVILAQMMCAWADVLGPLGSMDAEAARRAFRLADDQAWAAVGEPVEGTILSVSRASAEAAEATRGGLADVVTASVKAARVALDRTPDQLETLRRAGVVDAGGLGLVVVLETLDDVVHERFATARGRSVGTSGSGPRRSGPVGSGARGATPAPGVPCTDGCGEHAAGDPLGPPVYEVMYLLEAQADAVRELRVALGGLGDSLVVVGGAGLWHVHIHVTDPGAAVEAGVLAGRPRQIRIEHLTEQASGVTVHAHPGAGAAGPPPRPRRSTEGVGLVACAAGAGLAALFRDVGAVVVTSGPGRRPSTGEILDAVHATGASRVAVLPNDPDTLAVAAVAAGTARASGLRVTVIPTRAQVQGLAAAAVHDAARSFDADVLEMTAAAGATRHGAVTVAARDAMTMAGPCRTGDVLGVVQGDFAVVGDDLGTVACEVVDRLLSGGGELLTLVRGAGADPGLGETVVAHVRRRRVDVETTVLDGGQERYPLLIAVE